MHDPQTRPSLLERLRDSTDPEAWGRFERTYGDLIVGYCRRRGLQASDAEDVRQITFLKLMRSLKSFEYDRSKGRFRDYLYRVVRSAIADRLADRAPAQSFDAVQAMDDAGELDHAWTEQWRAFHMDRAWKVVSASIEERSGEVFGRLLEGQTVQQVASAYGMSPEAVHKIKQRVRDRMREQINRQIREEDGVTA